MIGIEVTQRHNLCMGNMAPAHDCLPPPFTEPDKAHTHHRQGWNGKLQDVVLAGWTRWTGGVR